MTLAIAQRRVGIDFPDERGSVALVGPEDGHFTLVAEHNGEHVEVKMTTIEISWLASLIKGFC